MPLVEINFDGIVGPSHNYAGLSHGNLAATRNAGKTARPRAAALQGIAKMRANLALGLTQGILLPHPRPDHRWLGDLATNYADAAPHLRAQALSASAMWAANAATVSPAPDTADGRCHLTVANLVTMPHRSHEWPATLAQLRVAFADPAFAVHGPIPASFGDEGAANHMRLSAAHGQSGVEVFVFGEGGGPFPARQHREASAAVARRQTQQSLPEHSTTTSSRSPTNACCSRMNAPLPTARAFTPTCARGCPRSRSSRCQTPRSVWPMQSRRTCSTLSW